MDYESIFWDMYDSCYEMGMKVERVMSSLGIEFKDNPDGTVRLDPDEYEAVVKGLDGKKMLSDSEIIEKLVDLLSDEFDSVGTFEDFGVLTMNKGIVINHNGKEYQLELLGSY